MFVFRGYPHLGSLISCLKAVGREQTPQTQAGTEALSTPVSFSCSAPLLDLKSVLAKRVERTGAPPALSEILCRWSCVPSTTLPYVTLSPSPRSVCRPSTKICSHPVFQAQHYRARHQHRPPSGRGLANDRHAGNSSSHHKHPTQPPDSCASVWFYPVAQCVCFPPTVLPPSFLPVCRWCPSRRRLSLLEEVETGMLTMLSKEVGRALRGYCPQPIREGLVRVHDLSTLSIPRGTPCFLPERYQGSCSLMIPVQYNVCEGAE